MKKSSLTSSGLNIEKIQSYKEENIDYFENGENDVQAQKISAIDKDISVKKYFIIQAEGFIPLFPIRRHLFTISYSSFSHPSSPLYHQLFLFFPSVITSLPSVIPVFPICHQPLVIRHSCFFYPSFPRRRESRIKTPRKITNLGKGSRS